MKSCKGVSAIAVIALLFVIVATLFIVIVIIISSSPKIFEELEKESNPFQAQEFSLTDQNVIENIVMIGCFDNNDEIIGYGSGYYYESDGIHYVDTNAHVILAPDREFYGCEIYFPTKQGDFYKHAYYADFAYLYHDQESIVDGITYNGIDFAILEISGPLLDENDIEAPFPPEASGFHRSIERSCIQDEIINFGDEIYVLGYPEVGGNSVTLTEGIVSGFLGEASQWIKVSAKVNPGNSGGVALSKKTGCIYGIPTQVLFDEETGSIGQVLSYNFIIGYLQGATGNSIDYSEYLSYSGYDYVLSNEWYFDFEEDLTVVYKNKYDEDAMLIFSDYGGYDEVSQQIFGSDLEPTLEVYEEYRKDLFTEYGVGYEQNRISINDIEYTTAKFEKEGVKSYEIITLSDSGTLVGFAYAIVADETNRFEEGISNLHRDMELNYFE